ncbi:MAG: MFS transporter [Actinomycetota bacterium]
MTEAQRRSAWSVATSRNVGPYFVGNAASASGTWFHNLAASVLVYRLTHSPFLLGVLNFSQFVPVILLAPWAGKCADHFDRRRLLLCIQPCSALVSGSLSIVAFTGHANQWLVICFSFCLGSLNAFTNAAQMALVGSLVPVEDLSRAVALNAVTFNLARAIGPVSAAAVIAAFGTAPAFAVNSLSFLVFTAGLLLVTTGTQRRSDRSTLRASLRVLREHPHLAGYLAVVMTVSFVTDPINTEGPALAHQFGLSSAWAGAIVGVFGTGGVIGGATLAGRVGSRARLGATLFVMGLGILCLGASPWFPALLVAALFAGFGYLSSNASVTAKLQLGVDESLRGRIMALWSVAFLGIRPIASMVDGTLSSTIGVRAAAAIMAVPAVAVASVLAAGRRSQRPHGEAREAAPAGDAGA